MQARCGAALTSSNEQSLLCKMGMWHGKQNVVLKAFKHHSGLVLFSSFHKLFHSLILPMDMHDCKKNPKTIKIKKGKVCSKDKKIIIKHENPMCENHTDTDTK